MFAPYMIVEFIFAFGLVCTNAALKLWFHSAFESDMSTQYVFVFVMFPAFGTDKPNLISRQ